RSVAVQSYLERFDLKLRGSEKLAQLDCVLECGIAVLVRRIPDRLPARVNGFAQCHCGYALLERVTESMERIALEDFESVAIAHCTGVRQVLECAGHLQLLLQDP